MSNYCAEIDKSGAVIRVVVAESVDWCAKNLGGSWVETADPYDPTDTRTYCGPGYGYDPAAPERFALALDVRALAKIDPSVALAVWRDGKIARGTVDKIAADLRLDLDAVRAEIELVESPVEVVKRLDSPA